MKKLKDLVEYALLKILFAAFRRLPLDAASWTGGFMARAIGPFMGAHRTAKQNLSMTFPHFSEDKKRRILAAMWDNLGRVAAELPHLPGEELFSRMTVTGLENLAKPGIPVQFFSGHYGNWELTYPIAFRRGMPVMLIYRRANNPYVDRLIGAIRATQSTDSLAKGEGGMAMLRGLKKNYSFAMLIDQKMNDGISVPFFGRAAMTAPTIAELALRYDLPIIPARVVRTRGCRFAATVYPPLVYDKTGDEAKDTLAIMTQINRILESWISEHPEQWFWVHKRWPAS